MIEELVVGEVVEVTVGVREREGVIDADGVEDVLAESETDGVGDSETLAEMELLAVDDREGELVGEGELDGVGLAQLGIQLVIVLLINVIAPFKANAFPVIIAPVFTVILAVATIIP